jgi:cell wall assembly regulator SMI1
VYGVRESWARIVAWCDQYAPETAAAIRPPAGSAALREVEASTNGRWPEDLRTWYTLMDGTQRTPAGYLLPGYCPLPLHAVRSHWSMWRDLLDREAAEPRDDRRDLVLRELGGTPESDAVEDEIARVESAPAGSIASMFLSSFIPFAEDQSGSDMFVDTRDGPRSGCVTEFFKGNADFAGPQWASVPAMLADVADSLETGRVIRRLRPVVSDQRLHWEFVPPAS